MTSRKKKAAEALKPRVPLIVLSNERNPAKPELLKMLYHAFSAGRIGLVDGMDPETGEVTTMIAGMEMNGDGELTGVFPIAALLDEDVAISIMIPDGKGNYVTPHSIDAASQLPTSVDSEEEAGSSVEQTEAANLSGAEPSVSDGGPV